MTTLRITKRTLDALQSSCNEFTVWDNAVTGFGVRVRPTGAKSYVVVYRAGVGRGAPVRRYTIAAVGKITSECARTRAKIILGAVAHGHDPELVQRVARMVDRNEYKRRQAPPGVRVSPKAFGKDRRLPITNRWPG